MFGFMSKRAATFNQTNFIEFLLEREAKLEARDGEGRSPFLNAVAAGRLEAAHLLLHSGADISATDLLMKTCIHIAVENENLDVLTMLLERPSGIDNLNRSDFLDRLSLHYAAMAQDIKVFKKSIGLLDQEQFYSYKSFLLRTLQELS